MSDLAWDIQTVSEEWLVGFCGRLVKEVAKFGIGVMASEAETQRFACQKVDSKIVYVPQVYRYFHWNDFGYLFMEYMPSRQLDELDLDEHTDRQIPGPIGGGQPQGYLWGDNGAGTTFTFTSDLEDWLNKRLAMRGKSIDLTSHPLVLCHMDLCRRNMILRDDNTISLVNWGCSGLYPRYFEFASLSFMMPYDGSYEKPLIQATATLMSWTDDDKELIGLLKLARAVALRYSLDNENKYGIPESLHSWCPPPMLSRSPSPS
ncbi:C6 zinc finger domain protein [Botrytis cinerea]